jgi:hypothetical protein
MIPRILKILVWIMIIASVGALWISLRSTLYSMEYGIVALGLWVAALGLNYLIKKKFR